MTENSGNEHKCPFCNKDYHCDESCGFPKIMACNSCYDKGLVE